LSSIGTEGIEPGADFDGTTDGLCDCENCQQCRAANALHLECFKGHFLASLDADLQQVIDVWERLPTEMRKEFAASLFIKGVECSDRSEVVA
jgi:hypothetical protein